MGERLRNLRREAGLSQAQLAGTRVKSSYISLIEAGKRQPSSEVVHYLAAQLGCDAAELLDEEPSERGQRIELEITFARLAIEHGEAAQARRRLEGLLQEGAIRPVVKDEIRLLLARACDRMDDTHAAIAVLAPLFERARTGQGRLPLCTVGGMLVSCYKDAGDLLQAVQVGQEALEAATAQQLVGTEDYYRLYATVLDAYVERGDYAHAQAEMDRLLSGLEGSGDFDGQAALFWNAAELAQRRGDLSAAVHLAERALGHLSELDSTRDYARLRTTLAELLILADPDEAPRAADLLNRCLGDLQDLGSPTDLSMWNRTMAQVQLLEGQGSAGEARARQAVDLSTRSPLLVQAAASITLADALGVQDRGSEAITALREAFAVLDRIRPANRATSIYWRGLAERFKEHQETGLALVAYERALDSGTVPDVTRLIRTRISGTPTRSEQPSASS